MKLTALTALVALAGCTALGGVNMTPEQLEAAAKNKDVSVVCVQATGPWGKAQTIFLNIDKSVITEGSVGVDDQCKATFTNSQSKRTP